MFKFQPPSKHIKALLFQFQRICFCEDFKHSKSLKSLQTAPVFLVIRPTCLTSNNELSELSEKEKNTSGTPEEIPGNERNTEEFIRPESQIHIFVCHFYLFSVQDLPPWPFSQRAKPGDGVWEPKNHRFISCFSNAIWVWNFGMDIYIYI